MPTSLAASGSGFSPASTTHEAKYRPAASLTTGTLAGARGSRIRQPSLVRVLPGAQAVIEHHPRAPERPREGPPVPGPRVKAVVVPKLHPSSMTEGADIRRGRHCAFALHAHVVFVTKYRHG